MEWARMYGVGVAPTERSTGQAPVRIDSPRKDDRVRGVVNITGMADSENFVAYRIEFGQGDPPLEWNLIFRSDTRQPEGGLAQWNTDGLPEGVYTLRLVLEDAQRGELSTFITVRVGSSAGGNSGGIRRSPTVTPTPPPLFEFPDGD
jgi:hypothetical protein